MGASPPLRIWVWGAGVALLVGGITLLKSRSPSEDTSGTVGALPIAERQSVQRFWQLYRRATDHRVDGRFREAAAAYALALELNEEHEDALYYSGNTYFELGEFTRAEQVWKRLVAIDPASTRAYSRLGDLYLCQEQEELFDLGTAEAMFLRAAEIYREETGPMLRLGEIALIRGEMRRAEDYFKAVTGSNYRSVEAHFFQAYLAWKGGDSTDAVEHFSMAVRSGERHEPIQGVMSEGDTKTGSGPMVAPQRHCQGIRSPIDDLPTTGGPAASLVMRERFARLDALLRDVRSLVPQWRAPS